MPLGALNLYLPRLPEFVHAIVLPLNPSLVFCSKHTCAHLAYSSGVIVPVIFAATRAIVVGTGNSALLGMSNTDDRVGAYESEAGLITISYLPFGKYASIFPEAFTRTCR